MVIWSALLGVVISIILKVTSPFLGFRARLLKKCKTCISIVLYREYVLSHVERKMNNSVLVSEFVSRDTGKKGLMLVTSDYALYS